MPLYMFDKDFAKKAPRLVEDYDVPHVFPDDLFEVLGPDRPDNRWLIIGSARSGSSFHKDPNQTSAWNACIRGKKKWILFPPDIVPPGVHPNEDGSSVATPVSLIEWFLDFYDQIEEEGLTPVECVVNEGDLMFVPRGWWHLALNLNDSICITQNYVSCITLPQVLEFFRLGNEDLVSGCKPEVRKNIYELFSRALLEKLGSNEEVLNILKKHGDPKVVCKKRNGDVVYNNGLENDQILFKKQKQSLSGLFNKDKNNIRGSNSMGEVKSTSNFLFNFG
eukprot:TRINITY_DN5371_c0_g1_i12.p2 TRINITY_DN5371_c0_g1~~TRINITY_DN5371_c0_g1_i12.p2  ORF type:complete len:278 (-),score=45.48 TRINITY_DN5371_c0_g1_i12:210-1043(-)